MALFQSYKKNCNKWCNKTPANNCNKKLSEMKLRSGRKTVNSSFNKVQNKTSKKKNKRQKGRKSGKAKKNRRKFSEVKQVNHTSPLLINKQPFVENASTPFLHFSIPTSVNIIGSVNNTSCFSNKPPAIHTPVLAACNANSSMNNLSLISDITMSHYINDSSVNANEDHTPLIVDVTNSGIDTSRRKRKRVGSSIVGNILNKETNSGNQEKVANESVKALHRQISAESSEDRDDDSSSVICVNSDDDDDDDEIIIVEKDSSDLPPSKRRKKDIPLVDLSTPGVPSHQNRVRNKNWEKWAKERRHFQFIPNFNVLSSNAGSTSVLHHSTNGVIQNNLHHTSKHVFNQYSSILGNTEKRKPVPSSSATVTSSACDKSGPGYIVDNSGTHSVFGTNMYNPNPTKQEGLRPIVIDGSNVALGHSNGAYFSCRGLLFCIEYFLKRNHKVLAFVPKFRKTSKSTKDPQILDDLEKKGLVSFTPSRRIGNQLIVPYDDRYIVQYAAEKGGVIVSTDNFRDLVYENHSWKETIEKRLLMFTWAGDVLMFPQDPLGRHGPRLEEFLRFPD